MTNDQITKLVDEEMGEAVDPWRQKVLAGAACELAARFNAAPDLEIRLRTWCKATVEALRDAEVERAINALSRDLLDAHSTARRAAVWDPTGEVNKAVPALRNAGWRGIEMTTLAEALEDGESISIVTRKDVTTSSGRTMSRFGLRERTLPANCADPDGYLKKAGWPSRSDIEAEDDEPRD